MRESGAVKTIARKRACLIVMTALAFSGLLPTLWQHASAAGNATADVFDVVILGGRVIDPESGLDAVRNIGIRDGTIAAISERRLVGRKSLETARPRGRS